MTTTTMMTTTTVRCSPHLYRSAPNFVLRRIGAAAMVVTATSSLLGGVLASFGGRPASVAEAAPVALETVRATHVARSGDTMWSIADDHRGTVGHDRYVDALIGLNGGTTIVVGQAVILP